MRHALSFLTSVLIHIAICVGIFWVADAKIQPKQQLKLQTVHFEFGEMIAARAISQEPKQSIQPMQKPPQPSESLSVEEPIAQVDTPQAELMPQKQPVVKPQPIVKKVVVPKKMTKPRKPKKKIIEKKPKKVAKKIKKSVKKPTKKKKKKQVVKKKKTKKRPKKQIIKKPKNVSATKRSSNLKLETFPLTDSSSTTVQSNVPKSVRVGNAQTTNTQSASRASAGNSQSIAAYRSGLWRAISRSADKNYPARARRRKKQGTVRVRFSLSRSGRISNISVVGGSGNASLDKAAVKALKRLGSYKAPPAGFPTTLTVPIRFKLR